MKQPKKWKETVDPFKIQFNKFKLEKVLGYPHARNDVFYAIGKVDEKRRYCFIKYASKPDSNIKKEINAIQKLNFKFLPTILDYDENGAFIVTKKVLGERLSYILNTSEEENSLNYMFEYGKTLALIHQTQGDFEEVSHRVFFDILSEEELELNGVGFMFSYLHENKPESVNKCFCHGDFHYANVLWRNRKITAVLDWELSGIGNKEFDIAWAIFNRPGQKFLKTKKERDLFIKGYSSVGSCNEKYVDYYIALIYTHFLSVSKSKEYHAFVKRLLKRKYLNK